MHAGVRKAIKGKCAVLLASGTPQDAHSMSKALAPLGVDYLDAFVLVRMHQLINAAICRG